MSTRVYYNGKVTNLEELEKALKFLSEAGHNVYGYNPEKIDVILKKTWSNPKHKDAFENNIYCKYAFLSFTSNFTSIDGDNGMNVWFGFGTSIKSTVCPYLNSLDNLLFNINNFKNNGPKGLIMPDKDKIKYQDRRIFFGDDAREPMKVELQIYLTNEEGGLQCVIDEVEVDYFAEEEAV